MKDLLLYDVEWWILGKTAKTIQRHHPALEIMSARELDDYLREKGSAALNAEYRTISAMCLGIAAYAIFKHVRIDSSAAVSYYYFSKNYETYREWQDELIPDPEFLRLVIPRISKIGSMNHRLAEKLKQLAPRADIEYIGHFVDHGLFRPDERPRSSDEPLVVGWAGDRNKRSKNYDTLFVPIRRHFERDAMVRFLDTPGRYAHEDMPSFYHSIDLLLITSSNEGGGATALEAFACGKPVLSTDVGYIREAAPSAAHELILRSDSPEAFIKAIDRYKKERTALQNLGLRCRQQIEDHWRIDQGAARWIRVLFGL